jgi:hypothetical protein
MKIIEGKFNKADVDTLEANINNNMFPWYFLPSPVTPKYPCVTHVLIPRYNYSNDVGFEIRSTLHNLIYPIIERACEKNKIKIKRILRGQINFTWHNSGVHSDPHWDHDFPHDVFIYYINSFSKGSTFIFKETYKDKKPKKIIKEITAKRGKYAIYPGENFHAAGFVGKPNEVRMICIYTFERS